MSEKNVVVQGAVLKCQFGTTPDTLKVNSHNQEYANDKDASQKAIATTKEIGSSTLQVNTFGPCKKQPTPGGYKPCQAVITEWTDFYKEVTLSNGGHPLLENSKATCPIGGSGCISITNHGQVGQASPQNFDNSNSDVQGQLNPMVNVKDLLNDEIEAKGVTF